MSKNHRKRRLRLGDIYEIPLSDGNNAYGRLYKGYTLAIYNKTCNSVDELPLNEDYMCLVAVYKDLLQDGLWPIVGFRGFQNEEDAWPPPKCVVDALTGEGSLYYKGEIIPCSYEECKDLEIAAVWDRHHLVDRLMGIDKWEKSIRRPRPY